MHPKRQLQIERARQEEWIDRLHHQPLDVELFDHVAQQRSRFALVLRFHPEPEQAPLVVDRTATDDIVTEAQRMLLRLFSEGAPHVVEGGGQGGVVLGPEARCFILRRERRS